MSGHRFRAARLAAAFALGLAAVAPAAAQTPFTDDVGRTVTLPATIGRVVAAGPPASILLYVLAPDLMAGWVRAPSADEKALLDPATHALPELGRLTGRGGTVNLEMIVAAKPDLILDVGTVDPTYVSLADRVQAQLRMPYVLLGGTFDDTPATLRRVGALLGREERAEKLAIAADLAVTLIRERLDEHKEIRRPRVYYGRGPQGLETGLKGSINLELLETLGAVNVAAAAGTGGLATVSPEQILAWAPDVILALDPGFAARVPTDPVLSATPAAKAGQVFVTPVLPFGWVDSPPGVNRVIGVAWLARVLYPDLFPGDLVPEVQAFFRDWYHVSITPEQARALIGTLP